jgi:alginate production protein
MRSLCLCLAVALLTMASDTGFAADLYSGKTFRITGTWTGQALKANRIQLREQENELNRGQITGPLETIDTTSKALSIGPFAVGWSEETEFKQTSAGALKVGDTIRVTARLEGDRLNATVIQLASTLSAGEIQLTGIATANVKKQGVRELRVLGVPVTVTQSGYNTVESLVRRQDTRRPEQPFSVDFLDRPLFVTGEYDATLRDRKNLRLDNESDVISLDHEAKLELYYPLNDRTFIFLVGKAIYEDELRRAGKHPTNDKSLARDQMWVFFDRLGTTGFGLQIGRQNFQEAREWWWDDDRDAVRMYYDNGPFHAEFAIGKEVGRTSTLEKELAPEEQGVVRFFGVGSWHWAAKQRLEFYALRQRDGSRTQPIGAILPSDREDPSDANLTWFGLRAIGNRSLDERGDLGYWADAALVRGREKLLGFHSDDNGASVVDARRQYSVRGSAIDLGASWQTRIAGRPAFTLGYAWGSGDDNLKDAKDSAFRQTGLHNNKWRFFGVNRFRYYGELSRPELSNLGIVTAAVGWRFLANSSVEVLYHSYRQAKASESLRDFRIAADLKGTNRNVGQEVDIVLGFRDARRWDLSIGASAFRAGTAYGAASGKRAYGLLAEFTYNF